MNTKISIITTTELHIEPLGESALLLSYGNVIDRRINDKIIALHIIFNDHPFPGFVETVPAYSSIAVFYDVLFIKKQYPRLENIFEFVKEQVMKLMSEKEVVSSEERTTIINIPVYYNGEDLQYIAALHRLSIDEVIALHTSKTYHVFMIGFLPGFAYMGTVDEKIATPRKETPRLKITAGSVGIAGAQTGIYPVDSPGGWQIIGTTPLRIFDKKKSIPCLLKAGDKIRFAAITKNEFDKLNEH